MKCFDFVDFFNRHYKTSLLLSMLCIVVLGLVVMLVKPLDLTEGGSSTWWIITKNVEDGNGYKACDEAYIPNCQMTDQRTVVGVRSFYTRRIQ